METSYWQRRRERLKNAVTSSNPSFYKEVLKHTSDGMYFLIAIGKFNIGTEAPFA